MTVKMIAYDADCPERAIRLEVPSPGHFNYLEPAFIACFPDYAGRRFSLVVQEVAEFPKDAVLAEKPLETAEINFLGLLSDNEFIGLVAGIQAPDMSRPRRKDSAD